MLSLDRFRHLLGPTGEELSEEELRELRQQMHLLAEVIVEAASRRVECSDVRQTETNDEPEGAN